MTGRTRVLVVDDHEMARRGLAAMLSTAGWIEVVGEADSCAAAIASVDAVRPDVVVIDIRMPDVDGLACLERIKARAPTVAVVMITLFNDRRHVIEAIRRGASGYLLKDAATADVVATLARVVEGQLAIDGDLLRDALAAPIEEVAPEPPVNPLSPREHDILRHVADGLTNKEIGSALGISDDTVKKHVQNVIWKLQAADRTQAAILGYRMGLLDGDGR